jgi:hypothetical protein
MPTTRDQEKYEMKFQMRSAAALLILSAVVAACGGGATASSPVTQGQPGGPTQADGAAAPTAPTGSTAAINACAIVTEQDATTLLGLDPGPGQGGSGYKGPSCSYGGAVTIGVDLNGGKTKFDGDTASMQGSADSHTLVVGDACAATIVANTIASMEILKGSTILTVDVQGNPTLQNITPAALTTLGTAAVGRI